MRMKREDKAILAAGAVLIITLLAITGCSAKQTKSPAPKPLVIDQPEPCHTGTLVVEAEGERVFEYSGEIIIRNDGRDGNSIDIYIKAGDADE